MGLKIYVDRDKDTDSHARKLFKQQVEDYGIDEPMIPLMGAMTPRECFEGGELHYYWTPRTIYMPCPDHNHDEQ